MSVFNIPLDLVQCALFPFLTLTDLGNLSAVCVEWRKYIAKKHAKLLCKGVVSDELLEEAKMNPLELLDMWERGQLRLSCGENHGAMISREGRLYMWEEGARRNRIRGLPENALARSIACGHSHTIVVTNNNQAFALGPNACGELGVGDTAPRDQLARVAIDEVQTALGGKDFTLFLTKDNRLFACGALEVAYVTEAGVEVPGNVLVPHEIPFKNKLLPKERISRICAGAKHILVLTNQNRLFSAGNADHFQLGREVSEEEPARELNLVRFPSCSVGIVQIAAGVSHSLVLLGDGSVYSFGRSSSGELGLPRFQDAAMPKLIPNLPKAIAISAGHQHSLILAAQHNKIVAFGMGALGQLGYRASFWSSYYPRDSPLPPKKESQRIKHISAGSTFSVCLTGDGQDLYACGKSSLCAGAGHGEKSTAVLPVFSLVPESETAL